MSPYELLQEIYYDSPWTGLIKIENIPRSCTV